MLCHFSKSHFIDQYWTLSSADNHCYLWCIETLSFLDALSFHQISFHYTYLDTGICTVCALFALLSVKKVILLGKLSSTHAHGPLIFVNIDSLFFLDALSFHQIVISLYIFRHRHLYLVCSVIHSKGHFIGQNFINSWTRSTHFLPFICWHLVFLGRFVISSNSHLIIHI